MRTCRQRSLIARFWSRIRGYKAPRSQPAPAHPFQAISIYRGVKACPMAHRFSEYRFLAKDAPPLPMTGCTMPQACECRYLKHKDRRAESRRLVDFATARRVYIGEERRRLRGRRKSD